MSDFEIDKPDRDEMIDLMEYRTLKTVIKANRATLLELIRKLQGMYDEYQELLDEDELIDT